MHAHAACDLLVRERALCRATVPTKRKTARVSARFVRRRNGNSGSATQKSDKDGWFRYYRNLHFQAHAFELTNSCQIIPYNFKLTGGRYSKIKQNVVSPYGILGIGFLVFNPQAKYKGTWVDLQPLRTEGQGLVAGRPAPYSLIQFIIPVGFGIQWEQPIIR